MPKLYLNEYINELKGKEIFIACREGILRDNVKSIVADMKFLQKHKIIPVFFHNIPNRFANRKLIESISKKIPECKMIRVRPDCDFYDFVLNYKDAVYKIIFLERRYLVDSKNRKLNSISTEKVRQHFLEYSNVIANINFKASLNQICLKIDEGDIDRIHILPAGKHKIKHELFTIEGTGTLISNNFKETFSCVSRESELTIIEGILNLYKKHGFLKKRTSEYIYRHMHDFYIVKIDDIVVGCAEKLIIDENTIELGAIAISSKFRNQQIGDLLVRSFCEEMETKGYRRIISLTNNGKLAEIYFGLGFKKETPEDLTDRQKRSQDVSMYVYHLNE